MHRLDGSLFNIHRLQAVTKVPNDTIFDVQYADDGALPSHTPDGLQQQLHVISSVFSPAGVGVNSKKTEVFYLPSDSSSPPTFFISGINLASLNSSRTWEASLPPLMISLQRFNVVLT